MSSAWFTDLLTRLTAFLRTAARQNSKNNLNEELQFHLEQSIQANLAAGMTANEARRQALLEFGGIEQAREETYRQRPGWLLETLLQDTRYALRGFLRNPAFTVTVIATLALGIGATTAVFSVVDRILFRSLPYAQDDRLVSLVQSFEKQEFTLGGFYYEWRDNQKPFAQMTFERGTGACNLTDANPLALQCAEIAGNFLPTFGIAPVLGRNFLPEEDLPHGPRVALLSYGLWRTRFNQDPNVLNQTIHIDGHPTRIVGVLPANFEMPRLQQTDLVLPAAMDIAAQHTVNSGIGYPMWAFARLKPGISIAQAKAEMEPLFLHTQQWIPAQIRQDFHLQVRSLRDRQMQEAYMGAWVLLGSVLAVLIIACANVVSLFSARAAMRERELAVRSALGAGRGRLVRQALIEAFLLALAGALTGCALAAVLLHAFLAIAPTGIPFLAQARLDLRIVCFSILLAFLCAIMVGIVPALQKPRPGALAARAIGSGNRPGVRLRRSLVIAQIAVSVILISCAGLLLKSFQNLERQALGMATSDVLTVTVPLNAERYSSGRAYMDFYLGTETALRSLPGVTSVAISDSLPPDGNSGIRFDEIFVAGRAPTPTGTGGIVIVRKVTPDYFRVLHIPTLQGRSFDEKDRNASGNVIILSKLLATRLFPQGDAVGRRMQFATFQPYFALDPTVFTVVGVAADVKNDDLASQVEPEYYTVRSSDHDLDSWGSRHYRFAVESQLPASVMAAAIRAQIAKIDPTAPVHVEPLTESVSRLADRPRFETALLGFFALTGLILAIIGLYGVMAYISAQRTQEIGVRMALGANRADILRLMAREGIALLLVGEVIGLATALAFSQLLRSLLFNISPRDPLTFLCVGSLLAIVALIATLVPARAATRVDPIVALRCE